jgi:hypothetical protein
MGISLLPVRPSYPNNLTQKTGRTTAESSMTSRRSNLNTGGDIVHVPKRVPMDAKHDILFLICLYHEVEGMSKSGKELSFLRF